MRKHARFASVILAVTSILAVLAIGFCSVPKRSTSQAPALDRCIGRCGAACQQMVIWYWHIQYGEEDLYLKRHDITKPASGPVSVDAINGVLAEDKIPIRYSEYKAAYDPQTKKLLPVQWDKITASLLARRPVIYFSDISELPGGNHTHAFVLVGYDKKTGLFYANDTYFRRIPLGKDSHGRLMWSKDKRKPINVQVLGSEAKPIWLTRDNLDKHKKPGADGCIFYYSPAPDSPAPKQ